MILALGLALVLASIEDHSNHLLAGGVARGDIEQVMGGMGLRTAKLVDQRFTSCPRDERADGVHVDDIRKGVASF